MKLSLNKKTIEYLKKNPRQKFTAREIAEWIFKTYPKECAAKKRRSQATVIPLDNDNNLIQQLIAEIGAHRIQLQKNNTQIKTTEERPRKYYFTEQNDEEEIEAAETKPLKDDAKKLSEKDLYPMLSDFLWYEYNIYSKRIDEKSSKNNRGVNGNKWLHPDLVAMEDLSSDWDTKIKDCVHQNSDKKAKLWSFEVKLLINRSNVRQTFFQAVSNSSWANYGYLVATELGGSDTKKELQILSSLHGIGFILLDPQSPAESQILIPARERNKIDWDTANRLFEENSDFKDFINEVTDFYQTGKTKESDWN